MESGVNMRENRVIEILRERFPESGIGDDAAVLSPPSGDMLLSADAVVEGVHYKRGLSTLSQVLQKVVTSNVSDIHAMGGTAAVILLTMGIPRGYGEEEIGEIVEGIEKGCDYYGLILSGGDTVLSPGAGFFSLTVLGEAGREAVCLRSGASPGDGIFLSGRCGGSALGLDILERLREGGGEAFGGIQCLANKRDREAITRLSARIDLYSDDEWVETEGEKSGLSEAGVECLQAVRDYLVPVSKPLDLKDITESGFKVTSMIDVSDGLGRDLFRLCDESGVGALIEEPDIPVPRLLERLQPDRKLRLDAALKSGEEYVKIVTLDTSRAGGVPDGLVRIGEATLESGKVLLRDREGHSRDISGLGYEHRF